MTGEEKFNTCQFRSKEKHFVQETWCCGGRQEEGYLCFRKVIDNIKPEICNDCIYYQPKDNGEENGQES